MSDEMIIRHCSPTLAGMKTGSMFTCAFSSAQAMRENLCRWNRILKCKGLRVMPLRQSKGRTLIYIYRPAQLCRDLQHCTAARLLGERGYNCCTPDRCISHLRRRLKENEDFPHEIGLFLGYPPEDVDGFISNGAQGCKCVGHWKVYGDAQAAQKLFEKYRKCTRVYFKHFSLGKTVADLII